MGDLKLAPIKATEDSRTLHARVSELRPDLLKKARKVFKAKKKERETEARDLHRVLLKILACAERSGDLPDMGANRILINQKRTLKYRKLKLKVEAGTSERYRLGIANNHQKRFFLQDHTNKKIPPGKKEIDFLANLARDEDPNKVIGEIEDKDGNLRIITVEDYYLWVTNNKALGNKGINSLESLSEGQDYRGPGVGSYYERRAIYALTKLVDAKLIKDCWICGDSASPLFIRDSESESVANPNQIDYDMHEEAMAIDLIAQLEEGERFEYAPLQIKGSGTFGFRETSRLIMFDPEEKERFIKLVPESEKLFIPDSENRNRIFLPVYRNVFYVPVKGRKIAKSKPGDYSPDLANLMLSVFEFMHEKDMTLKLDRPYQSLSYAQKVKVLMDSENLRLNHDYSDQAL